MFLRKFLEKQCKSGLFSLLLIRKECVYLPGFARLWNSFHQEIYFLKDFIIHSAYTSIDKGIPWVYNKYNPDKNNRE